MLHLWFYFCLVNKFLCTTFLDSLFSHLKCLGFPDLIFRIVYLYIKSSSSIVFLLGLVVNYIVTFFCLKHQVLLKIADSTVFSFWNFFELKIIKISVLFIFSHLLEMPIMPKLNHLCITYIPFSLEILGSFVHFC